MDTAVTIERKEKHEVFEAGLLRVLPSRARQGSSEGDLSMSDTRPRRITLPRVVEEALVQRWSLIPCGKNKKPLIQSWKEFQIKAASSDQIMEWHRQLRPVCWGVVTGAISNL